MSSKLLIKSPCKQSWDKMLGGDAIRHCEKCHFNVYKFSEMTSEEIETLLSSQDKVCARLLIRPDGTYMTKDCNKKIKRNRFLKVTAYAALIPLSLALFKTEAYQSTLDKARGIPGIGSLINTLSPPEDIEIMGEVCPPPPPQNTANQTSKQ